MSRLERIEADMNAAQKKMTAALEKEYPKGKLVFVMLRHGQVISTPAKGINHSENYLRVKLDTEKESVRNVHFNDVV